VFCVSSALSWVIVAAALLRISPLVSASGQPSSALSSLTRLLMPSRRFRSTSFCARGQRSSTATTHMACSPLGQGPGVIGVLGGAAFALLLRDAGDVERIWHAEVAERFG